MLDLYRNIKKYRQLNQWSQSELAKRIGYSDKSMIAKIENGLVDLPLHKIHDFASVFGVSPMELMGWSEPENDFSIDAAASLINEDDPLLQRLVEAYEAMDEKKRELLVNLAESMK